MRELSTPKRKALVHRQWKDTRLAALEREADSKMRTRDDDEQQALFESLDAMCAAYGWDDTIKEQIRREMELTRPREPGDTVH